MSLRTRSSRARRRAALRPRLEGLEDRALLSASIYTVNSTGNGTSGSGNSGTLPYVIGLANNDFNPAGSEIQFDPTVFSSPQTITLTKTLSLLEKPGPESIVGPGPSLLTVQGGGSSSDFSVFSVGPDYLPNGVTAGISGLTIANGHSGDGGGVNNIGAVTLTNVTLSNNTATFYGGGVENLGTATLINVTLSNNTATGTQTSCNTCTTLNGGGGGLDNAGTATLTNVTFNGNTAGDYGGGGVSNSGTATLTNVTFSDNTAARYGGGVYNDSDATAASPT